LCLKLEVPLVIVITKFDLTTRTTLNALLRKVLSMVQQTGRRPKLFMDQTAHSDVSRIPSKNDVEIMQMTYNMAETGDLLSLIPIVLTSSVTGIGIGLMHALLKHLPRPPKPTPYDFTGEALNPEQPACLFHIDDRFSLPASYGAAAATPDQPVDIGTVVAGYLRFGTLAVGDQVLVGPFSSIEDELRGATPDERASPSPGASLSASHPLSSADLGRFAMRNAVPASTIIGEWHIATIVSIRNLRLPVQTLDSGQAGTIGIILSPPSEQDAPDSPFERLLPSVVKIRKGMILAVPSKHMIHSGISLQAASGLTVRTRDPAAAQLAVGSLVNIYVATVRALARVSRVSRATPADEGTTAEIGVFNLHEHDESQASSPESEVQLELLSHREWVELGSRILILEGGRNDRTGLEAIVGNVIEIVD
jgi:hypothetical protein